MMKMITKITSLTNSFARIESVWKFKSGLNFLMQSISNTKQSNLLRHFLRFFKWLSFKRSLLAGALHGNVWRLTIDFVVFSNTLKIDCSSQALYLRTQKKSVLRERSEREAGRGGGGNPYLLPGRVFRFALASSCLAIPSARSTIISAV